MRPVTALATVMAILVFFIAITAWVVVIAVARFSAAGGGVAGLKKSVAGNIAGAVWVGIALAIWNAVAPGNILALSIILAIAAFLLCIEALVPILGFISAAFLGAGTWIGGH